MNVRTVVVLGVCGAMVLGLPSCKNRKEGVKQDLADSGYELTPEAYFRAAESDDTVAMDKMIKNGIALQTLNTAGDTALHAAAIADMQQSVKFLLDRHIPVDVSGANGRTPLMATVALGKPDMVRYLLKQGADPMRKDADGYRPLLIAVREGRADMIGELAPYDREDLDNAMLAASLMGRAKEIDELVNYGASVYARMDDGRTALMVAAENGHMDAVKLLLDIGANRFSMDEQGRIAADVARDSGHEDIAQLLLKEPSKDDFSLENPSEAGTLMQRHADAAAGSAGGAPRRKDGSSVREAPAILEGAAFGKKPAAVTQTGEVVPGPPEPPVPVIMRGYLQKELPVHVDSVRGTTAMLRVAGGKVAPFEEGAMVPGSPLKIVRIQKKMKASKQNGGVPMDISVVEVEDTTTGSRREMITGIAASSNEPVALVEDSTTGKRYVASAGQHFKGSDGTLFRVTDVRPNQMVVENPASGEVWTVPLRGPRG